MWTCKYVIKCIGTDERYCGEPAISLHSYTVPLVQWSTRLLPVRRDPGSIPRGVLMWNQDSPVSGVLLHWWPRCDWSLWPHLRRALSRTVTRLSCRQCGNPTWSHMALLSRFHAHCRWFFRLHKQHSRLLGGGEPCGEPAISLHSYTVPPVQWSTHLLPVMRGPGSVPRGVLMWNRDSPVSVVSLQYNRITCFSVRPLVPPTTPQSPCYTRMSLKKKTAPSAAVKGGRAHHGISFDFEHLGEF